MKEIKSKETRNEYLAKYKITSHFKDADLPFILYEFERGEFLNNAIDPIDYLSFFVAGKMQIMHIREDGTTYMISEVDPPTVFGDMEFASGKPSPYLIEVIRKSLVIALPLQECRKKLRNDPVFLRYLLKNLAKKISYITAMNAYPKDLKERVIHYMTYESKNHTLTNIEATATHFSFSKRQLLRILKELCQEGSIEKTGKGKYILK